MSLITGTRLGPYEIIGLLGAGGMGEVYKARDTRLQRTVAVKVLPSDISADPDRRARFEREAKTIAGLADSHICTLHDVGEHAGSMFLVMEHLDGETLAHRLEKGPLPIEQALTIATDIADALSAAHRQGIVHRDLKPGNIMLTKGGAKLLDFGLAKLRPAQVGLGIGMSAPVTQTTPLTGERTILGTLQYMAPEQLEGNEADPRTDIFAFGAVVYEMVTGKKAFESKSQVSLISSILERDVPLLLERQPSVPPLLDWIVRRCLAKQPDERWQTAADLVAALRWIAGRTLEAATAAPLRANRFARVGWGLAAASWVALAAVGIWMAMRPSADRGVSTARLSIQLPSSLPIATGTLGQNVLAISPDGTRLAYLCQAAGERRQICLRSIHAFEVTPLRGTAGAAAPFFSPDGEWLGFHAEGKLQKIAVAGGAPVVLAEAADIRGAAWAPDNTIVYTPDALSPIFRIPASGGTPAPLTTLDTKAGEVAHRWPTVLSDGAVLYVSRGSTSDEYNVRVFSPRTGQSTVLVRNATFPRYAESGHLVFWRRGSLLTAPFDADRLELTGAAVPVVQGVAGQGGFGFAQFAISEGGSLLYVPGDPHGGKRSLMWVDRSGVVQPISAPPRSYGSPRISPDGQHVAVIASDPQVDIWVYALARGTLARLTFDAGAEESAIWSPHGKWITYTSAGYGGSQTLRRPFDGSGVEELLFEHPHHHHPNSWAPDGKTLALEIMPETGSDIVIASLDNRRSTRPFAYTSFLERTSAFSPDGRWIAYASNESGRVEVYVQAYPGPGGNGSSRPTAVPIHDGRTAAASSSIATTIASWWSGSRRRRRFG